ncbi:sulfotransferase [Aureococcus anophagefferens]|nr:sulfotransferase [Aureococcus anophagefferens]
MRASTAAPADECVDCEAGTYQGETGQSSCALADAGSFVKRTARGADRAMRASTAARFEPKCDDCVAAYQELTGQSSCALAGQGFYVRSTGASEQTACPAEASPAPAAKCGDRSGGAYQDATGQSSCKLADGGSFVDAMGASEQAACDVGKYSGSGASECIDCAAGTFQESTGQSSCALADGGSFVDAISASEQTACPAGSFSGSGASACDECEVGTYSTEGDSSCTSLPGFSAAPPSGECSVPDPRARRFSGSARACDECEIGTFSGEGESSCTSCPAGYSSSSAGASECSACPVGTFKGAGSGPCIESRRRSSLALNGVDASAFNDDAVANAQLKAALEATLVADLFSFMVDSAGIASVGPPSPGGSSESISSSKRTTAAAGEDLMSTEELVLEDFELDLLAKIEDGNLQRNIEEAVSSGRRALWASRRSLSGSALGSATVDVEMSSEGVDAATVFTDSPPGGFSTGETSSCPPGTFSSSGASECVECERGSYTDDEESVRSGKISPGGSFACGDCEPTSDAGKETCTPVDAGSTNAELSTITFEIDSGLVLDGLDVDRFSSDDAARRAFAAAIYEIVNAGGIVYDVPAEDVHLSAGRRRLDATADESTEVRFVARTIYTLVPGEDVVDDAFKRYTESLYIQGVESPLLTSIASGDAQSKLDNRTVGTSIESAVINAASSAALVAGGTTIAITEAHEGTDALVVECPAGTISAAGESDCTPCSRGTYSDALGQTSCKLASPGFYAPVEGASAETPCPGAHDPETMDLKKNFWRASIDATSIYECILDGSCKGGANSSCARGHKGPLCGACKAHYFYDTAANRCVDCGNKIKASGDNIIGTLLAVLFVVAAIGVVMRKFGIFTSAGDKESSGRSMEQNVMTKAKIVIATYQIACSIPWSLPQVRFPAIFKEALKLGSVVNLSFISFAKTECFGGFDYFDKLLFVTLLPVVFVMLIAVGFGLRYACVDRSRRDEILSGASYWILFTLYVLVPSTSAYCLRYFACAKYDGGYGDGVNVMRIDPTISCDSPTYDAWLPYVLFSIVAYPVGVPLGFACLLWRLRRRLDPDVDHQTIAIGLLGSLISYRVFSHYEPYVEEDDGVVSEVAQTELVLVFFYADAGGRPRAAAAPPSREAVERADVALASARI